MDHGLNRHKCEQVKSLYVTDLQTVMEKKTKLRAMKCSLSDVVTAEEKQDEI